MGIWHSSLYFEKQFSLMLLPYSASIKIVLFITLISFLYGWWDEFQLLNFYVIFFIDSTFFEGRLPLPRPLLRSWEGFDWILKETFPIIHMAWSMKKVVSFNKEKNNLWHALAVRHSLSCRVNLRFPSRVYIVGIKKSCMSSNK